MKKLQEKPVKKINKKVALFKRPKTKFARITVYPHKNRKNRKFLKNKHKNSFTKFKSKKPYRRKILTKTDKLKIRKNTTPVPALNQNFYRAVDGVYFSYWFGKLINTLQKNGKKSKISSKLYGGMLLYKYTSNSNPILAYFELLDRIKPIYKLRNYIARRGAIKKYPVPVFIATRLTLAIHWLKKELKVRAERSKGQLLQNNVATLFADFREDEKKTSFPEKQKEYMRESIAGQFNIRFTYRKK